MEGDYAMYDAMNEELIEAPPSAGLRVERPSGWGSVPGLEDNELLDERELERWMEQQEWGPVLALPIKKPRGAIRPSIDEEGHLRRGAFGAVDFERMAVMERAACLGR